MATPNPVEIFEKGKQQVIQTEFNGVPVFVVPDNMKVETLEKMYEKRLAHPERITGTETLTSQESFIEYYNRFSNEDSVILVDNTRGVIIAIFDYHGPDGTAGWREHKAIFKCTPSKEWGSWKNSNNCKYDQEDFALFIEEMANDIVDPEATTMLEIASTLKAKKEVDFRSSHRLDNGQTQFMYNETIRGNAGESGQLEIPEVITIAAKPLHNGESYKMQARFRYKIREGRLSMWYTLIRPHLIFEDAVNGVLEYCRENMGIGSIYLSENRI